MIKSILGMLLACLPCSSVLYAQGFCSDVIELPDCFISPPCTPNSAGVSCEVQLRYSLDVVPWVSPAPFGASLNVGSSNCDPTFYFDIKKSSEDFANTLNSERANWNQAGNLAFFKGPNARRLTFFDDNGEEVAQQQFLSEDFFTGPNSNLFPLLRPKQVERLVSEIRWHPTETAIFYPRQIVDAYGNIKGSELIKREIDVASSPIALTPIQLFHFMGFSVSGASDNFKIAGGDGNDVHGGRFLLSLKELNTSTPSPDQYVVYDFDEWKVVEPNIAIGPRTYSETFHGSGTLSQALFSLPSNNFDYATVSASGLFIVAVYSGSTDGGVYLYDLRGGLIRRQLSDQSSVDELIKMGSGHIEVGYYRLLDGTVKECIVAKATGGVMNETGDDFINEYIDIDPMSQGFTQVGDIIAVFWNISDVGLLHEADSRRILDWQIPSGTYSGGQFSLSSTGQTEHNSIFLPISPIIQEEGAPPTIVPDDYPFRLLLSNKAVDPDSVTWEAYFGEVMELSLDESDLVPRRILHHRITIATVEYQPEAWFNRTGTQFFFKSHYDLGSPQDLYFVELPPRTCASVRNARMANPNLLEETSYQLFPSPLHSGGKLWLEVDSDSQEVPQAHLRLTSLDGRVIQVWSGPVESGSRIQAVLPNLAAGIYVAELVHAESGAKLMQQKVLVR
jgi:hypothetical protein